MLPCAVIEQLQRARQARPDKRAESSKRQTPSPPSPPPLTPRPPRHRAQSASSMPRALLTLPSRVRRGGGGRRGNRGTRSGSDGLRCELRPETAYSTVCSSHFSHLCKNVVLFNYVFATWSSISVGELHNVSQYLHVCKISLQKS